MTYPLQILTLAVLYVLTGWIGVNLDFYHTNISLIWLPTGLSLAALILFGRRLWPGAFIGSLTLNALLGGAYPMEFWVIVLVALSIAAGNTLEVVVAAWLMVERFDFRPNLSRVRDVVVLIGIGGAASSIIAALIGVTGLWLGGDVPTERYFSVVLLWWLGAFGGVVALTPFLLVLRTGTPSWRTVLRNPEFALVVGLLAVACLVAFGGIATPAAERLAMQVPLPCLAWAGVRLGTRGAVLVSFSTIVAAVLATAHGIGPLVADDPHVSMTLLWTFCVGVAATALTLAAAIAQRNSAEALHEQELAERVRVEREHLLSDERERIVRDMHDVVGGQLVSALSMVQRGQASDQEVAEALRRSLDDMRMVIDSLEIRKSSFNELLGKLRVRLEPLMRRNGLRLEWRIEGIDRLDAFDPERALHCVRVIQEAASNVIQHARATMIAIDVSVVGEASAALVVEVRDDGVGLSPDRPTNGRGTQNIASRADALGAELFIESAEPGRRVRLVVPVDVVDR